VGPPLWAPSVYCWRIQHAHNACYPCICADHCMSWDSKTRVRTKVDPALMAVRNVAGCDRHQDRGYSGDGLCRADAWLCIPPPSDLARPHGFLRRRTAGTLPWTRRSTRKSPSSVPRPPNTPTRSTRWDPRAEELQVHARVICAVLLHVTHGMRASFSAYGVTAAGFKP